MKVEDIDANASRCVCPGCPTYDECMSGRSQRLYCGRGVTDCDPRMNGCKCGECPVWTDHKLSSYYFCREGAAD